MTEQDVQILIDLAKEVTAEWERTHDECTYREQDDDFAHQFEYHCCPQSIHHEQVFNAIQNLEREK